MHRRDFLRIGGGVALAAVPAGCSHLKPPSLPARSTPARRFDEQAIAGLQRLVPRVMRERSIPGASLAIIADGRVAWQQAWGHTHSATQSPVDASTVFEAASVSKTVFAYAALKLCERGILQLDTPLTRFSRRRFLPDDPRIERVTPRHALSHTTGFPDWRAKPALRFEANPGERFHYSGEGYYYLQSVVSEVAGRTFPSPCGRYEADFEVCATDFDDFMQRTVLEPMGMSASGYLWRDRFETVAARGHGIDGRPLSPKKPNATDVARYGAVGELHTTAGDYAKFLLAVLHCPSGEAFLGPAMWREMIRPNVKLDPNAKIDGADSWALGWAVQERPTGNVILHSGGQSGFRSLTMASVERKSGFALFTNSDNGGYLCFDPELGRVLTPLLEG